MKYHILTVLLTICSVIVAQNHNATTRSVCLAEPIDYIFFEQLDSIVKKRYNNKFNYYNLMFCDKNERLDIETNFIPTPHDSIYYFILQGTSVIGRDILVVFKGEKYNLRKTSQNIIVKKKHSIKIQKSQGISLVDLKAPIMILKYHDKKLDIIKEYRTNVR